MLRQIGHSYDFLSGKSRDYGQFIKGQKWSAIYFPFLLLLCTITSSAISMSDTRKGISTIGIIPSTIIVI